MQEWSAVVKRANWISPDNKRQQNSNERLVMKRTAMIGLVAAALIVSGAATSLLAQNIPGNGRGYGGPPKSEQERIARQAAGQTKNGGICPNGGPRANCPGLGQGKGQGQGQGKGQRRGACDGTGPRAGKATCPANGQMQK
jgi:hypothetical protein